MAATISFFPVGNGDMTLIELESGLKIVIDVNIRVDADNSDKDTPDVAKDLRRRLTRDAKGRLYVDAFLVSHADKDHCSGLERHFHLGPPANWSKADDKIFIREVWSSPMVFRRKSKNHVLCPDAAAFNCEARRRVARFRESGSAVGDGDRILILGEDQDGKTDDLTAILVKVDQEFSRVNGAADETMTARLLAPQPKSADESEEELRAKNRSSTILNFSLTGGGVADAGRFLTGGDAEVAIWERLWKRHSKRAAWLEYDILLAPHHCSWHSLSYDSWSKMGEKACVCDAARSAVSQTRKGARIVASSDPISDDDRDPPCVRAKREYESIAKDAKGSFLCVGESASSADTVEFEIGKDGPRRKTKPTKTSTGLGGGAVGSQPLGHG
jgi:hypothetical protein